MPAKDDELLARLNALKPSTVSLAPSNPTPSVDVEVSKPQTAEDRLADRLKALRSGSSSSIPTASTTGSAPKDSADALTARMRDEVATEDKDPIRDWQAGNDGDEQTLEDLLAELGTDDQWKMDPDDPKHVNSLLKEAKAALPDEETEPIDDGGKKDIEPTGDENEDGNEEKEGTQTEEQEADDYVQRVLADLDIEKKYGADEPEDESEEPQGKETTTTGLELPSTPQTLKDPPPSAEEPSTEDSELEARFSKLGLDLPSTPTTTPSSKAKAAAKTKGQNVPKYTDDDIESWCCICNEDGEVRCLGCDEDIYCHVCWREGHGNGPGQEQGHRAVQFTRKGGGMAAAA